MLRGAFSYPGAGIKQGVQHKSHLQGTEDITAPAVLKAYHDLQRRMQQQHLGELLMIDRLCTTLHIMQRNNAHLKKLKDMHVKHIRPLIARLQAPSKKVVRSELIWLVKMSQLLPPFLEEFMQSVQELRQRAQDEVSEQLREKIAAPAA